MQPHTITPDSNHSAVTRLMGWSIIETGSAAATVNLRKKTAVGQLLFPIILAADGAAAMVFPQSFLTAEDGVWVEVASGSVSGVLFADD